LRLKYSLMLNTNIRLFLSCSFIFFYVFFFFFFFLFFFFFSSRRRHTRSDRDWSSDVCSSDLQHQPDDQGAAPGGLAAPRRDCG